MSEDVERFRRRAAECRELGRKARDQRDRELLDDIAEELDEEARKMETESEPSEVAKPGAKPNPD
jgi:hypothetical protein